jgi:hypothetical protein
MTYIKVGQQNSGSIELYCGRAPGTEAGLQRCIFERLPATARAPAISGHYPYQNTGHSQ